MRIGVVHPYEFAFAIAPPDGLFDRIEKFLKRGDRGDQALALHLQFGQFGAQVVEGDETREGIAAGNPALNFDDFAALRLDGQIETLCVATKFSRDFSSWLADDGFSQRPKARKS